MTSTVVTIYFQSLIGVVGINNPFSWKVGCLVIRVGVSDQAGTNPFPFPAGGVEFKEHIYNKRIDT